MAIIVGAVAALSSFDPGAIPPFAMLDPGRVGAKLRKIREVFDLTALAAAGKTPQIGDQLFIGRVPAGAYYDGFVLDASVSLGTAQIAIGTAGVPAKYKAAGTFTAIDTPTSVAPASLKAQAALPAFEDLYVTVSAAAFPNAGLFVVETNYLATA